MIGDGLGDVEAGRAAGVRTALVFATEPLRALPPARTGRGRRAGRSGSVPGARWRAASCTQSPAAATGRVLWKDPLEQILMALFIDSSDPKEIKDLFAWGVLSGVTTNPLIIAKEAPDADLGERIREVLAVSWGDVSVELTTETESEMIDESLGYHAWDPARITIKVPFSETGLRVLHQLVKRGIKTNVTCLMAMNQAYLAALAGATYVSIFSGRVRDMGYDVRPVIAGHARRPRPRGPRVEDHRRLDAPPHGRQRGARGRRPRADGHAAHPAQDGVEPADDRDDQRVQHRVAQPPQEEVRWHAGPDKHVLVTGGAGFIGSHVADALLARGARVTVVRQLLDGLPRVRARARGERWSRRTCSTSAALDEAMRGVDFVFHLAANADIKDNLIEPRKCIEQNVVVTQNVLEAMRAAGTREIAFASTGSVYGEPERHPHPGGRALSRCRRRSTRRRRSPPRGCSRRTRSRGASRFAPGSSGSCRCWPALHARPRHATSGAS